MNKKILTLILFLLSHSLVFAQNCGKQEMNRAKEAYEIGRFEDAVKELLNCKGEFEKDYIKDAYRLLSVSFIELDKMDSAYVFANALLNIQPDFPTRSEDPLRFRQLISDIRKGLVDRSISSVSKSSESLAEAPATVLVVSDKTMEQRGYNDFTEALADLPGFDITLGKGPTYSHIYQRGYRSTLTDRTLLLIDGVEENDLSSNHAFISRQIPMSNVKRLEVIHGPTSTMYGANAFAGVINVVTKDANDYIKQGRNVGFEARGGYGTFNTRYLDATFAARYKSVSLTLTGRWFRSDEMDLSSYEFWDYRKDIPDATYTSRFTFTDNERARGILTNYPAGNGSMYNLTVNGSDSTISPTQTAIDQAKALDLSMADSMANGAPIGYTNYTDDWAINAKLKVADFTLGFQTWRRQEGNIGWYNTRHTGSENGGNWVPKNTFIYLKYEKYITDNFFLTSFTRYKNHELTDSTLFVQQRSYENGRRSFENLLGGVNPEWYNFYFYRISQQLRSELRGVYTGANFNIVGGFEFRSSILQGNYLTSSDPLPSENSTRDGVVGGNHYIHRDLGLYLQSSYNFNPDLKAILGIRLDNNKVRVNEGYGTVLNYRAGLVYSPNKFVLKALYSTAFKDASNFSKYATAAGRELNNPFLEPESVDNYEFSISYDDPDKKLNAGLVAYYADYSNIISTVPATTADNRPTTQFQNIGELSVAGLQATVDYRYKNYTFYANYNFTDPVNTKDDEGDEDKRVADIASHRINMGVNGYFFNSLNVNFRMNYVGARETGPGTTAANNPLSQIDAYTVFNATVNYTSKYLEGVTIQLAVNNVFDAQYSHPGIRDAAGITYSPYLPQNTRTISGRLILRF